MGRVKRRKSESGMSIVRRAHTPNYNLPQLSVIGKAKLEQLQTMRDATIHEMQNEYGSVMAHSKVEQAIERYFFPELLRGMAVYLEARVKSRKGGVPLSDADSFYLSEDFDEHMRNWQKAITTNYHGPDPELMQDFFRGFYTLFVEQLKKRFRGGVGHLQLPE